VEENNKDKKGMEEKTTVSDRGPTTYVGNDGEILSLRHPAEKQGYSSETTRVEGIRERQMLWGRRSRAAEPARTIETAAKAAPAQAGDDEVEI